MLRRTIATAVLALILVPATGCGPGWKPLFNGRDLTGWQETGQARWSVEDGAIVGMQGPQGQNGDLVTVDEYSDFDLAVTYKVAWPANSGIWFRFNNDKGYQFDILKWPDPVAFSGTLYCPGKMFITKNLDESLENRDGWNKARIRAEGDHIRMWLNGRLVSDVRDDTFSKGRIGFQVHAGDAFKGMKIIIREAKIRILTD